MEVARSIDLGVNDQRFYVRSHIGALLKPGDLVMGYDLANSNLSVDIEELPDVVLVRKKRQKVKRNNKTSGGNKGDQNGAISTVRTTLAKGVNIADNEDDIDSVFADMEEDGLI